jgi:glycosyltransferase involved in cell wall biosynthesis
MKILFFARLFYPHIGGVEKHVIEIGKRLAREGHSVIVVTEQTDSNNPLKELIDNIEVYRIPFLKDERNKKFEIWKWLWRHRLLIMKADIIHCHDIFFWYLPFRFLYPTKKVYTTFHGYEMVFPIKKKAVLVRKLSEKLSFGNICLGDYLKKWYRTKPTYVIYGGVEKQRMVSIRQLDRKLKIAFLGRVEADTGFPLYISALQELKKRNIKFYFNVYGDGKIINIAKKYGKCFGFVKNVDKAIKENDVIFASSYLSILESLNNKRFVCSVYSNPLKKDILEMTPFAKWISISNNANDLTQAVLNYAENPQKYTHVLKEEYAWVSTQTWDDIVEVYKKLWKI